MDKQKGALPNLHLHRQQLWFGCQRSPFLSHWHCPGKEYNNLSLLLVHLSLLNDNEILH